MMLSVKETENCDAVTDVDKRMSVIKAKELDSLGIDGLTQSPYLLRATFACGVETFISIRRCFFHSKI